MSGFRSSSSINPSDSNSLKCWVLGFWAVFVIVALKCQSGAFGNQSKKVAVLNTGFGSLRASLFVLPFVLKFICHDK